MQNLFTEEWKDVPFKEFSDRYLISSSGKLKSKLTGRIASTKTKNNYLWYKLTKNYKTKFISSHTLVALAFIGPKPTEKHSVNHKNGKKDDNRVENLEWSSPSEQIIHAHSMGLISKIGKKVIQYSLQGEFIAEYNSTVEAAKKVKADSSSIHKACCGKYKTTKGFLWKFGKKEDSVEIPPDAKNIPEFQNCYKITKEGILYSSSRGKNKIINPQKETDGYLKTRILSISRKRSTQRIHQLVAKTFLTIPESLKSCKIEIDHKDGNKLNNHVDNLEYVSNSENQLRSYKLKREKNKQNGTTK